MEIKKLHSAEILHPPWLQKNVHSKIAWEEFANDMADLHGLIVTTH